MGKGEVTPLPKISGKVSEDGQINNTFKDIDPNDHGPPPKYETIDMDNLKDGNKKIKEDDPWALADPVLTGKPWKEMTTGEKAKRVLINTVKGLSAALLLYFFICSIDLLGSSFQLVAGRTAGEAFTRSELLNNPVCGLMIGVGVTVLLQSSSTSTSIVVTMVAAQIIPVRQGIYIIMGANIGTSVTNTIVAMGQIADKDQFRRAFAGATVHDMFNWMAVLILLPIEVATGYLYYTTLAIVKNIDTAETIDGEPMFLEVITKPLVEAIIRVDKDVIYGIAEENFVQKRPLCRYLCDEELYTQHMDYQLGTDVKATDLYKDLEQSRVHPYYWVRDNKIENIEVFKNETNITNPLPTDTINITRFSWTLPNFTEGVETSACGHWFVGAGLPSEYNPLQGWPSINLSDAGVGAILLVMSLFLLCTCLILMVKLLQSLLQGPVLIIIRKVTNGNITCPSSCEERSPKANSCCNTAGSELTGYLAILVGTGLTILVQSSSVFTSAITPLVGMGIISIDRMYPLTLGANIGTTITSLLAAFTSDPETIQDALQVSLAHLLFNITGILIFYPIPFMRKVPVYLAKKLGETTTNYRWFAVAYIIIVFFIAPFLVFALSIPGWYVLASVLIPLILLAAFVIIVNVIQEKNPTCLPPRLQSWDWCPSFLCSLEPYDKVFRKICFCCKVCNQDNYVEDERQNDKSNIDYDQSNGAIKMEYNNGDLQTVPDDVIVDSKVITGHENASFENDNKETGERSVTSL